ncbi:MAG: alpha-galactosidase [Clostridiales bacterium]|nr:alpha-galactosidase [Clostridiales bacterium]
MAIQYNINNNIFTLNTKNSTYQMQVDSYGFLLHLYYGRKMSGEADFLLTFADRACSGNPYDAGNDRTYSLDALPQEFPCRGSGDFRSPAILVRNEDNSCDCDLRYRSHVIYSGKYGLRGLPAVYAKEREAQTLELTLEDAVSGLQVVLLYGVLEEYDVITRAVRVINNGEKPVHLTRIQSVCLDFLTGSYDCISFYGRHAMERQYQRIPVSHGAFQIGSRRGTSSHQYNPMMLLAPRETTEDSGICYSASFVYSGGFRAEVEMDQFNQTRMLMGLAEEQFSYPLGPGEDFYAPEVILSYSREGLNKLSQNLHACFRKHLCRGKYRDVPRPVLLNSWEAFYFDFNGEKLCDLARAAADAGIEMLVMDDGWFGKRDDDNSGLGDWFFNEKKMGMSLEELADQIHGMGLKLGIWFEPECINEDSDLYRAHPEWALAFPGRKPVRGRNQLVLDFSRKDVVDYLYEEICSILDGGGIEYLKWDFNRSIADVYSGGCGDQGGISYDYILGLYDLLERLIVRYPDLLIEGCCGGGGRFDAGMLYYTPQIWCSDNTDAIDRVKIQYGTSFGYPISAVGSHVSVAPNEQNGRVTPLQTRSYVAMSGTFGYELDIRGLSGEEKEAIRAQIADYHRYAPLILDGLYYRLTNPFRDEVGGWEFVSEDRERALCFAVMLEVHGNMTVNYLRVKGLLSGRQYRCEADGKVYDADILMEVGLPFPAKMGEYRAYRYYLSLCK